MFMRVSNKFMIPQKATKDDATTLKPISTVLSLSKTSINKEERR